MADESGTDNGSSAGGDNRKRAASAGSQTICRDFMRNVCTRGTGCRYYHPTTTKTDVEFCDYYQTEEGCTQPDCAYLHCTVEEIQTYKDTSKLPTRYSGTFYAAPVCKDYQNGTCQRMNCRFRHEGPGGYAKGGNGGGAPNPKAMRFDYDVAQVEYAERLRRADEENYHVRRRLSDREDEIVGLRRRLLTIESENDSLRKKLNEGTADAQLRKQVVDLTTMNEILLDQNSRLKVENQTNTLSSYSTSVANVQQPPMPQHPPSMVHTMAGGVPHPPSMGHAMAGAGYGQPYM